MPRYGWKKRWIRLYVTGWLHGSIRWQFTSEERGVWADLMAFAGEIQKEGRICDNDGRSLPRSFIANQFNIKETLLNQVIAKCLHEGRITIDENEVLTLSNYETYQSEYERQKPYRERAKSEAQKDREDTDRQLKEAFGPDYQQPVYSPEAIKTALASLSDEEREIAIEAFGQPEEWDDHNWIAATGHRPKA